MEIIVYREKDIVQMLKDVSTSIKLIFEEEELLDSVLGASILFVPLVNKDFSLIDKVQNINSRINIISISDDVEGCYDAFKRHLSGYLLKPYTEEDLIGELENIRYGEFSALSIQCFGKFDLMVNGISLPFPRKKAKELLALLVDHRGGTVMVDEICEILFNEVNDKKRRYIYVLKFELIQVLKEYDLDKIVCNRNNGFALDMSCVDCDYYKYCDGQKELFHGEYMSQYPWAKKKLKELIKEAS
ncbi:MAG: hypothetical protein Q4C49_12225 [Bacillota bacterium]|nr:hypothetical protein [Bacillota bacterium]